MEPISSTVQALLAGHADWDTKYADTVTIYHEGLLYASVCTSLDDAAVDTAMAELPSGTSGGWSRSIDTHFVTGEPNPCPCDTDPTTRRHVLYEA